jgi:hypothetical protein
MLSETTISGVGIRDLSTPAIFCTNRVQVATQIIPVDRGTGLAMSNYKIMKERPE